MFDVGLFISQTNRSHPLPLVLPHVLLRLWLKSERFGEDVQVRAEVNKVETQPALCFVSGDRPPGHAKGQLLLRGDAMTTKET